MTDTGRIPAEGLPENTGSGVASGPVQAPEAPAGPHPQATSGHHPDPSAPPRTDGALSEGAQGGWGEAPAAAPGAPDLPGGLPGDPAGARHQPQEAQPQAAPKGPGAPDAGSATGPQPEPAAPGTPPVGGTHESGGRDSGSVDVSEVRTKTRPQAAPARRPLHLGPPVPDPSTSLVRPLSDRGPAGPPTARPRRRPVAAPRQTGPGQKPGPAAPGVPQGAAAPTGPAVQAQAAPVHPEAAQQPVPGEPAPPAAVPEQGGPSWTPAADDPTLAGPQLGALPPFDDPTVPPPTDDRAAAPVEGPSGPVGQDGGFPPPSADPASPGVAGAPGAPHSADPVPQDAVPGTPASGPEAVAAQNGTAHADASGHTDGAPYPPAADGAALHGAEPTVSGGPGVPGGSTEAGSAPVHAAPGGETPGTPSGAPDAVHPVRPVPPQDVADAAEFASVPEVFSGAAGVSGPVPGAHPPYSAEPGASGDLGAVSWSGQQPADAWGTPASQPVGQFVPVEGPVPHPSQPAPTPAHALAGPQAHAVENGATEPAEGVAPEAGTMQAAVAAASGTAEAPAAGASWSGQEAASVPAPRQEPRPHPAPQQTAPDGEPQPAPPAADTGTDQGPGPGPSPDAGHDPGLDHGPGPDHTQAADHAQPPVQGAHEHAEPPAAAQDQAPAVQEPPTAVQDPAPAAGEPSTAAQPTAPAPTPAPASSAPEPGPAHAAAVAQDAQQGPVDGPPERTPGAGAADQAPAQSDEPAADQAGPAPQAAEPVPAEAAAEPGPSSDEPAPAEAPADGPAPADSASNGAAVTDAAVAAPGPATGEAPGEPSGPAFEAARPDTERPAAPAPAPGYDEAERQAVLRVMRERRDVRNGFRNDPIPPDVLLRVLEAAHAAPSVDQPQPWDFVVIRSEETRRTMHELAVRQREAYAKSLPKGRAKKVRELKTEAVLDAPVNIVVTADPARGDQQVLGRHTRPGAAPYSAALAVENLWLAARAEGLGVGWVSFFDEREVVRVLGLPEHLAVVAYLCIGYVDEFPPEPEPARAGWSGRRPLSWVVHEEAYGRRALPGSPPHDLLAETVAGIRPLDAKALGEAWERQKRMTKPSGALGVLEIISAQLSGLSRMCPPPVPEPAAVAIFAGDHGVHAQGVTPWPQEVTSQMVANFLDGGAVCNAFAAQVGAEVCVVDVGVAGELAARPGLLSRKVRAGTGDITTGPALTREEVKAAVDVGIETARDLVAAGNKALLTGEMGIANTTVSAALIAVFTGADPAEVTGRGTGVNDDTLSHKTDVVRRALERHQPDPTDPLGVLAAVGGLEHAALVGLLLGGASLRTPVVLDGVTAGAAALAARAIAPEVLAACVAGHRSAEPGHQVALAKLGLRPLIDLDLRLGEGTGALLALPLIQSTARAMHEVATFDSAGVTER